MVVVLLSSVAVGESDAQEVVVFPQCDRFLFHWESGVTRGHIETVQHQAEGS